MELQELIARARFTFNNAPNRLEIFKQINGKRSAKEISKNVRRSLNSTLNDLKKLIDLELITQKRDGNSKIIKKNNAIVYDKVPLARQIPTSYYQNIKRTRKRIKSQLKEIKSKTNQTVLKSVHLPNENEILDICKDGETQVYEFKTQGTDTNKITKEVAALANSKTGGIIFYGIEDDGTIVGTDKTNQQLDQSIQNSIKHNISPPVVVSINKKVVLGQEIILISVPPWNHKDVYHYDGKVYIRKGTNCLGVTSSESRKLHDGEVVI